MALPTQYLEAKAAARRLWENGGATVEQFDRLRQSAEEAVADHPHIGQLLEGMSLFAPPEWVPLSIREERARLAADELLKRTTG